MDVVHRESMLSSGDTSKGDLRSSVKGCCCLARRDALSSSLSRSSTVTVLGDDVILSREFCFT